MGSRCGEGVRIRGGVRAREGCSLIDLKNIIMINTVFSSAIHEQTWI